MDRFARPSTLIDPGDPLNRTCQLALGALVLVASATGAHDGRAAGPTAPVSTITQPTVPHKFVINVGIPAPLQTTGIPIANVQSGRTGLTPAPTPIPLAQNVPYEHTLSVKGSRAYVAAMDAQPSGKVSIYSSSDSGSTWTFATDYQTSIVATVPPDYFLHCANVAVDAGNPDIVYLTYYADGGFGSILGFAMGRMYGTVLSFNPSTSRVIAESYNHLANLICPDIISPSPGSVIVADVISGTHADSVGTWTSTGDYGAGIALPTPPSTIYALPSNTNTVSTPPNGCRLASNNNASAPHLFTNGNGTVCVTFVESSGCTPGNTGGRFIQCSSNNGANWTPITTIDPVGAGVMPQLSGAISPSGSNVAVAWVKQIMGANEIVLAFSNTSGTTWLPAMSNMVPTPTRWMRPYPSASRNAIVAGSIPDKPVLAWESDSALWLGQTISNNGNVLMLDRTADNGVTWMGAVGAGSYIGTSVLSTASGMVATGFKQGTQSSVTLPLSIR
jgi:surface antigen